jgi:hypothetical protein
MRGEVPAILKQLDDTTDMLRTVNKEAIELEKRLPETAKRSAEAGVDGAKKVLEKIAKDELNPVTHINRPVEIIKGILGIK